MDILDRFFNAFLTKKQRKLIAIPFLALGFFFSTPPIIPSPDDFILNIPTAKFLYSTYNIPLLTALVATYTIIPLILFAIGILIYPKKDGAVIHMVSRRIIGFFKKNWRKYGIVIFISGYIVFNIYIKFLSGFIK